MNKRRLTDMLSRRIPGAVALAVLICMPVPHAAVAEALPAGESEVLVDFVPPLAPDAVAVDKTGNVFVSFFVGDAWKFAPGADPVPVCELFFGGGLAIDPSGNAFVIGVRFEPVFVVGVFRIPRDGGECEHIPGTEIAVRPNALAFDNIGNLYLTDSTIGRIFRIAPDGAVELWIDDPLLHPVPLPGDPGFIVGANGIQYWQGSLIVANTTQKSLVRVPILADGSAGTAGVLYGVAANPGGPVFFPDGLALDVHGDIYATDALSSQLVRVSADGMHAEIFAAAFAGDPLDGPTAAAFGTGMGDRKNMFVTNSGFIDPAATGSPSLIRIGTGVPGNPLP